MTKLTNCSIMAPPGGAWGSLRCAAAVAGAPRAHPPPPARASRSQLRPPFGSRNYAAPPARWRPLGPEGTSAEPPRICLAGSGGPRGVREGEAVVGEAGGGGRGGEQWPAAGERND
jgi:hypothetical protein